MPTKDRGNQKVKCSGTTKRNALLPSVPPAATPDKLHIVPAGKLAMLQAYSRAVELGFGELWKRIHVVFSRQRGRLLPPGAPASPSVRESGLEFSNLWERLFRLFPWEEFKGRRVSYRKQGRRSSVGRERKTVQEERRLGEGAALTAFYCSACSQQHRFLAGLAASPQPLQAQVVTMEHLRGLLSTRIVIP
uniref:Uncharacterized protein n=1 Tax=Rangifer tarandus platyrhynchus TaxID=3082113 RepID=A0ACB0DPU1_RANTA|nr:unnamed protein product [Rangifer tarandus platyrhynchus]